LIARPARFWCLSLAQANPVRMSENRKQRPGAGTAAGLAWAPPAVGGVHVTTHSPLARWQRTNDRDTPYSTRTTGPPKRASLGQNGTALRADPRQTYLSGDPGIRLNIHVTLFSALRRRSRRRTLLPICYAFTFVPARLHEEPNFPDDAREETSTV